MVNRKNIKDLCFFIANFFKFMQAKGAGRNKFFGDVGEWKKIFGVWVGVRGVKNFCGRNILKVIAHSESFCYNAEKFWGDD